MVEQVCCSRQFYESISPVGIQSPTVCQALDLACSELVMMNKMGKALAHPGHVHSCRVRDTGQFHSR